MIENCTALILTGGDSRRMGRDKASLVLDGLTLLQRVVNIVQPLFAETIISVRQPRQDIALPQVCDDPAQHGPLAGLAAGLERATTPWVFAVACDMPFITPAVIEHLAACRSGSQAVVPVVQGHAQPLAAFYARDCLQALQLLLGASGQHSFRALLERLRVCHVDEAQLLAADPQLRSFFDLDTPEDVAAAQKNN